MPLETSPGADGYDKAASWFSTFGPKYFAFPCFKAFNSIASSVLQKVSIEAKKFREAEGFEQEIWLARKTVVELKTIMGEYSFLKDTSTPAAEARMQKLENARNVVEKAMSRVSCAAEQLEGFVATQIAQSDEDARKADEEKGLALLQKYNNDLVAASQLIHMHISAIGTQSSLVSQARLEDVVEKIDAVKALVDDVEAGNARILYQVGAIKNINIQTAKQAASEAGERYMQNQALLRIPDVIKEAVKEAVEKAMKRS